MMLQLLDVLSVQRVLEIGSGSVYNAVILAKLVKLIGIFMTVERYKELV